MNEFHNKINKLQDLLVNPKMLDDKGKEHVRLAIQSNMERIDSDDILDNLPFIISFLFDGGFKAGVQESIRILQER